MDILILGQGHRESRIFEGRQVSHERRYIDFIVSGQSLKQRRELAGTGLIAELIGLFGWIGNKAYENAQIDEFLCNTKPQLPTGRIQLYVCPECGDIGCGAITAKIVETRNTIVWSNFGYENDYSEPNLVGYEQIGPFEFDKAQYRQVFEELRRELNK